MKGLNHSSVQTSQGMPIQEERNGPLPSPKPPEPSTNHTSPGKSRLLMGNVQKQGKVIQNLVRNNIWAQTQHKTCPNVTTKCAHVRF